MKAKKITKGDKIAIVAPAKAIEERFVQFAIETIERYGYKAVVTPNCLGEYNYFSGTVEERLSDFQWALDQEDIKAILCARGGYGSIHLMDKIDWDNFLKRPKWLLGFSDITVFHQYLSRNRVASIHCTMPLNFRENSPEALDSLFDSISGKYLSHEWTTDKHNVLGSVEADIVGGNLSVLTGLVGTKYQATYYGKILFIEDVGEYLYAIDRDLHQLKNAEILNQISGLIVGDFSNIKDTEAPFGASLEEIILSHFSHRNIPIAFGFPGGHLDDNRAIVFNKTVKLEVGGTSSVLRYLSSEESIV